MEIILEKSVYDEIQEHIALYPAERGGILGIRNGYISKFYYDSSAICSFNEYIPDTVNLDLVIDAWSKTDIDFIGFVHSHTPNRKTLSPSDKEYAVKVLEVSPSKLILLESYKTIKLSKFKLPAKDAAS